MPERERDEQADPLADLAYHLMQWHMPPSQTGAGVGTLVAEGKEVREFDGRWYVMVILKTDKVYAARRAADPLVYMLLVLLLSVSMCVISGLAAVRKAFRADPAELFM